jgi:drug/metabolite transporter (DMT)-like permease
VVERFARTSGKATSLDIADLVMLMVVMVWAGNNVLTKSALGDSISARTYVFLRLLIVTALLFGLLGFRQQQIAIPRDDYGLFLLAGISGYAAYNMLFVLGLARTSAFTAAILVATAPVVTLLLAAALRIERVHVRQWIGVIVAFVGVAIFVGEKLLNGRPAGGDVLNLLAAVAFAIYGLSTQSLVREHGAQVTTAWSVLIGLVAVLPFTLPAVADEDWQALQWRGWIAVLYAAVLSMLLAYTLWSWAIGRRGAGRTVPYLFLIPVFTGILAMIFLDDTIGRYQLIGAAFALTGVALARRSAGGEAKR